MRVPLTIADHLERAALVYPDRIGVVDEPDQPAPSWGSLTYRRVADLARGQAAALDGLGVGRGERVAIVSHNAARLLVSFFGVSAWGRVLVPVNFRLNADEIGYIVEHSGASVLLLDPELDEALADIDCKHRYVLGAETDALLWPTDAGDPEPWDDPDEEATATINYTSGTTARPKGVQMTHRNLWVNAAVFGWQTAVNDRDVYLHTLPMFHCNGWGMPFALAGMGATQVALRKVDGAEILRRVEQHGVTLLCGAPAVVAAILDAAADWDGDVDLAQRHLGGAHARQPERHAPTVAVEHGQGVQVDVAVVHRRLPAEHGGVDPEVAMGHLHALGAGGGAAGVVDGRGRFFVGVVPGFGGAGVGGPQQGVRLGAEDVAVLAVDVRQGLVELGIQQQHRRPGVLDDVADLSALRRKFTGTSTRPQALTPKKDTSSRAALCDTMATRSPLPTPSPSRAAAWPRARSATRR